MDLHPVSSSLIPSKHLRPACFRSWSWLWLLLSWLPAARAHRPSDGWIQLTVVRQSVHLRLDLALKDLDAVLGLDANDDGNLTWAELRHREQDLIEYVTQRLTLTNSVERLTWVPEPLRLVPHEEILCASFAFTAVATNALRELTLTYRCLFELDPQHRALVQADWSGGTIDRCQAAGTDQSSRAIHYTGLLSPAEPGVTFMIGPSAGPFGDTTTSAFSPSRAFQQFFAEGVHHIWTGYDHLLFLTALLLPSVLLRRGSGWEPAPALRPAVTKVLQVVTSFTAAHSLTLALAAFGVARPPSRIIESAIAASVLFAAVSNLWRRPATSDAPPFRSAGPKTGWMRWRSSPATIPFAFGLIHGFGFANALAELGLAGTGLAVPLIAFNLGVESGQLACVALFLPVAYALRATVFYRRGILPFGSVLIACVASAWFLDRVFNRGLMPF